MQDIPITYTHVRSSRARRVRLAVYHNGTVVVTSPFGVTQGVIEKFLLEKKQWVWKKVSFFKSIERKDGRTFSHKDYVENKEKAMALVNERIKFYNELYGFSFNKVFIKNQKTRWGSCSGKRNINVNYKVVFLPEQHRDYIVVHELCHLKEFNHSKKFWGLVAQALPNYKESKKELRHHELLYT